MRTIVMFLLFAGCASPHVTSELRAQQVRDRDVEWEIMDLECRKNTQRNYPRQEWRIRHESCMSTWRQLGIPSSAPGETINLNIRQIR